MRSKEFLLFSADIAFGLSSIAFEGYMCPSIVMQQPTLASSDMTHCS
jgi:hypothetical protein